MNAEKAKRNAEEREARLKEFHNSEKWKEVKAIVNSLKINEEDKTFFLFRIESAAEGRRTTEIDLYLKIVTALKQVQTDRVQEIMGVVEALIGLVDYSRERAISQARERVIY